jgi:cell shape-determining protein MreD
MGKRKSGRYKKTDKSRAFARWACYSGLLLVLYMFMVSGAFYTWQPVLIIPLAVAVAMRTNELNASIFGAVCGLVLDIAYGRLFGFTGIWLLPTCLGASLLVSHLIKANLLNFLWINAVVCTLTATADYFFFYVIWNTDGGHFVLADFIIPAHFSAAVLSPIVYFAVKFAALKFAPNERVYLYSGHEHENNDE